MTRVRVRTAIARVALLKRVGMNNGTAIRLFVDMQIKDSIPSQRKHCREEYYQYCKFYFSKEIHQTGYFLNLLRLQTYHL